MMQATEQTARAMPGGAEFRHRAFTAYSRSRGDGEVLQQPSESYSGMVECGGLLYMVLRNGSSTLAVYRIQNDDTLRRMKRWPKALESA